MAFKNAMAHGPDYLGLKAVGPYMEPLFHNNGQIFDELLSLHMNLRPEVAIYKWRAIILAFMAHGPDYLGLKAVGPYMETLFHNNGQYDGPLIVYNHLLAQIHMQWQ